MPPSARTEHLGRDVWAAFYKAWLEAFLEVVPTKAELGQRMRLVIRTTYAEGWSSFWPYADGRSVPTSTIGGWLERASLPTDPAGNIRVTQVVRKALVRVVTAEITAPPPEVVRLAERAGIEPPAFSMVVEGLAKSGGRGGTAKFTEEVDKALAKTCDLLTRLPNGHPPHLRSLRLAEQLRLLKVDNLEELTKGDGLYTSRTPYTASADGLQTIGGERTVVVLGNPGGGKTTLLAAYCVNHISGGGLALFVRLDDLGRFAEARREANPNGVLTLKDAVNSVIEAWDNWRQDTSTGRTRAFLAERVVKDKDTTIAFDGLDEVAFEDHRLSVVREILRLLEDSCCARLIVASRITAYISPFEAAGEYFVDRLSPEQLEAFVHDWFSDRPQNDPGRRAALQAVEGEHIGWLARTPVVAGIVCFVAKEEVVESTLFGLYRQYLNQYFRRGWRSLGEQRTNLAAIRSARVTAQRLAWAMAGLDGMSIGTQPWLDTASLNALLAKTDVEAEELLELYQRDGVLVSFGRAADSDPLSQKVRWMHRTVHEHLAGRQLAEHLARDGQTGLLLLAQAALRPEWEVALDHVAGGLHELDILEPAVDALWALAACHDTASNQLVRVGTQLLIERGSTHRQAEVVEFLIRHHEWHLLAKVMPKALSGALKLAAAHGRSATEISSLQTALAHLEPAPDDGWELVELGWKVSRELDLDSSWFVDKLAWKVDPRRMFEVALDRLARETHHVFPDDPELRAEETARVVELLKEQLRRGNAWGYLNNDRWLQIRHPGAWEDVQQAAKPVLGDAFVSERARAWREDQAIDWDAVGPGGLGQLFATSKPWLSFNIGWDFATRGLSLPSAADEWAVVAYEFAGIEWTYEGVEKAHNCINAYGKSFNSQLSTDWSASPEALRQTLDVMIACAKEPSVDRIQMILKWSFGTEPSNHNPNHIHLDASWFTSFLNFLPWRLQVEAGLRQSEGLSATNGSFARALVEWTVSALATGLQKDASPLTVKLVQQFIARTVRPEQDPQVVLGLISMFHGGADSLDPEVLEEVGDYLESRAVQVLPPDSELLISLLDGVDRARYVAGLLPKIYERRVLP